MTAAEAARRLGMSLSWFRAWAKADGIEVVRRGRRPGVSWRSVEAAMTRSRILAGFRSATDPEARLPGVALIAEVCHRYGWTLTDLARALGVTGPRVSEWRRHGVPERHLGRLDELAGDGGPEPQL